MIQRTLFSEEHFLFRSALEKFVEKEVRPNAEKWDEAGGYDRSVWRKFGDAGFLCTAIPIEYGGMGGDRLTSVIVNEVCAPAGNIGLSLCMHSDIVAGYLVHYASEMLKQKYLPKMATGEMVGALAMTEPSGGSDVQSVKTTAVRDGDSYIINGSKTFISNGSECDLVIVVAKTDKSAGAKGISLFVVDTSMPGFEKGKRLKKVGLKAQDTAELFFNNVRVPAENMIGEEGKGFIYLMQQLPWERLLLSISAIAAAEAALEWTVEYTKSRTAFGKTVFDFQNSRFKLAEIRSEIQIGRVFIDKCIELDLNNKLDAETASIAKYWSTEMQCRVVDECVQLHGGYGYMFEYPIARAWTDARAQRIYGGTNEIMKELIARAL